MTVHSGKRSGTHQGIYFRSACNRYVRTAVDQFAFCSLRQSEWGRACYDRSRKQGHGHHAALRVLGAKWLKSFFALWQRHVPYREETHLAARVCQQLRQAA